MPLSIIHNCLSILAPRDCSQLAIALVEDLARLTSEGKWTDQHASRSCTFLEPVIKVINVFADLSLVIWGVFWILDDNVGSPIIHLDVHFFITSHNFGWKGSLLSLLRKLNLSRKDFLNRVHEQSIHRLSGETYLP